VSAVRLDHVRKLFPPIGALEKAVHQRVVAVDDVSLELTAGDRLGIIGSNGAGKSTLLQIIAGLSDPTAGSRRVDGRVTTIMTLGVGLRDLVSGRENIYLDGELQGKSRRDVDRIIDEVIAFSELGDFIDQPARTYSTGMKARLAFSMLVHIDPEIVIIDEALSVGDASFSRKATDKIREICARGKILILVSHSMAAVREMCNRCIWLDRGRIVMDGAPAAVCESYIDSVRKSDNKQAMLRFSQRVGSHSIEAGWRVAVALGQGDVPDQRLLESGAPLRIHIEGAGSPDRAFEVTVDILRLDGAVMFAKVFSAGDYAAADGTVDLGVVMEPLVLGPAIYRIDVALVRQGVRITTTSAMFEVYTSSPITGGKPMLIYPVDIDVAESA
jgi:lipopolysaccharide transport system ATP-binding protein